MKDIVSPAKNLACMTEPWAGSSRKLQVAIDGPAGSGKSTVAKRVARALGYLYLDTGAMYRALAVTAMERGISLDHHDALGEMSRLVKIDVRDEDGLFRVWVDGKELTDKLRGSRTDQAVKVLAMVKPVREALVSLQRAMADSGGVVMEGRDITSVVMPRAEVKVFLTAKPRERARRRWQQMQQHGMDVPWEVVLGDLVSRDNKDLERDWGKLVRVEDAVVVDTSGKTIDETCVEILALCEARAACCTD